MGIGAGGDKPNAVPIHPPPNGDDDHLQALPSVLQGTSRPMAGSGTGGGTGEQGWHRARWVQLGA